MVYIPAGEIIGEKHQIRTVSVTFSSYVPDGVYQFIDLHCVDPDCDCRKTMIQVFHNGRHVSTINYGWEPREFYEQWMGDAEDEIIELMYGASIDMTSPDLVSPEGMLEFFKWLLNDQWIEVFKANYAAVKQAIAKQPYKRGKKPPQAKRTRRTPRRR